MVIAYCHQEGPSKGVGQVCNPRPQHPEDFLDDLESWAVTANCHAQWGINGIWQDATSKQPCEIRQDHPTSLGVQSIWSMLIVLRYLWTRSNRSNPTVSRLHSSSKLERQCLSRWVHRSSSKCKSEVSMAIWDYWFWSQVQFILPSTWAMYVPMCRSDMPLECLKVWVSSNCALSFTTAPAATTSWPPRSPSKMTQKSTIMIITCL